MIAAGKVIAADDKPKKLLFYTKSAGFEHSVVKRDGDSPAFAERVMMDFGKKHGFEVTCSKDGRIFDKDYEQFDAYFFYTTENLTHEGTDKQPPMSEKGKQNLLDAVKAGKGFGGSHCASDTFHSAGDRAKNQEVPDPYIQMIGGEFIRHGEQQEAMMRVADLKFPGVEKLGAGFNMHEEWYSLKNFAPDMHVILVQETKGMRNADYARPPYPATWARKHGQGRVFYTSMGHREDVWQNPTFESVLIGGLNYILGRIDADVTPNLLEVTPEANTMPKL
jgi:type 1 glutamine amidotransferase